MIREPQKTYLLELLIELGSAADDFVLSGAQAMTFNVDNPRYSKDFDFLLDVISLRKSAISIAEVLKRLKYSPDPKAKNFQFTKEIPDSKELMRIEFMASAKEKRPKDPVRVDIQDGVHAFQCIGAEIVLQQYDYAFVEGSLPDGKPVKARVRFAKPNAVLMLKLLAINDRYKNFRRPDRPKENRERARVHTADSIKIVRHNIQDGNFSKLFWEQFGKEDSLRQQCSQIVTEYFKDIDAPGIQLYREFMQGQYGVINEAEVSRALREMKLLL